MVQKSSNLSPQIWVDEAFQFFIHDSSYTGNCAYVYKSSCETQTTTEIYVDNWEMYELFDAPTLSVEPSQLLFDVDPQEGLRLPGLILYRI